MFRELFTEAKPKLDKKSKEILKWVDDILGDLTEALSTEALIKKGNLTQGSFKEVLAHEINKFKKLDKFYTLNGKIAIDGVLPDGSKVIKQVPFPEPDIKKRDDIIKALNVRVLKKFNLHETTVIKKGDEFSHKRLNKQVQYIELIKKNGSPDMVKIKIIRGSGKGRVSTISTKVFRSSYDLEGKIPA